MQDSNRISVATAARLMGASEQFIRVGLQQKELPFGFAIKMSGQSFVYDRNHVVKEINVDRVVITYNNIVVAAVKKSDLTLVE